MDVIGVIGALSAVPASAAHLTISGAAASVGVNVAMMLSFTLLTWWTMSAEEFRDIPEHAPDSAENWPVPTFLEDVGYESTINIAVFGASGTGKSSLVNALRGKRPGDTDAAPVGVEETTTEAVPYNLIDSDQMHYYGKTHGSSTSGGDTKDYSRSVRIWDLPGAGTTRFPTENSVRDMGLRYFDVVMLVVGATGGVSELDQNVLEQLENLKVPHFIVRSQVDCDLANEVADNNMDAHEVLKLFRDDMAQQGFSSVFMVSARHPDKYDFKQLVGNMVASVQARRRVHKADCCPICFESFNEERRPCSCQWCLNSVCSHCTVQMVDKLGETPCPFCRRWTKFNSKEEASFLLPWLWSSPAK